MNKITIIGGGPAGLATAYYSKKNKIDFELFEAGSKFGGNCITINSNKFYFDSGAHRLHDKDPGTTKLFINLLKGKLKKIHVPSQIYYESKFIDFPISPLNLIKFLGVSKFFFFGTKIILGRLFLKKGDNFKEQTIYNFGKEISSMFLLNYSEKLWGFACENLSPNISGKRLKGHNLYTLFIEMVFGKIKKTSHLDGSFYYPDYGIGTLFDALSENIGKKKLQLNSYITKIYHDNNIINSIVINNSDHKNVEKVVSSIPIDKFINIMSPPPPKKVVDAAKNIMFRNVILIAFFINKNSINKNGSMYFPSKEYLFTRIYEPKNRSEYMAPKNKTSLIVEVPCFNNDSIWTKNKSEIINDIKKQILTLNFFKESEIIDNNVFKISNAYPVLEKDYYKKIRVIVDYISKFKNLNMIGRNGLFEYSHIHDHFIDARKLFKKK